MKFTENKSNHSKDKEIFIRTVIITAVSLALVIIGYIGMGYFMGVFR